MGDPQTGETDCYGPYADAARARAEAHRRRRDLDAADLADVVVAVAPCSRDEVP
ncbi:hypothetical protein Acsp06_44980 [Actinomycetospora sp. NBRC 106375]|uniref:hypothetical protein n=1 Tax=Actinomycetospora sp. NBRC 106375 TaxID=3032207 RepID=UPI0024A21A66|nr:hypothetical protein [Actinomycetospora sp. NBRC 106375]GLZ48313.1 hypothetical protein Acsp06_44980 [Actinomycetospora sp. NBRC 106375]